MMLWTFAFCLILLSGFASALKDLPEWAKGGKAYQEQLMKTGKLQGQRSIFDAYTWSAPVGHFNNASTSFKQRYYINDLYWKKGSGPVFFEIGGEGTLNGPPGGYLETLAKEHNALLIALEHRFYGASIPNNNLSTENYQFLTVEQALADLAGFTDYYKGLDVNTNAVPWFVFGGSYPGALASWYRTAYPSHSKGSLSSSGVVNCIIDYYQFDMQVSAAAGNDCSGDIARIQSSVNNILATRGEEGFSYLKQLFFCDADIAQTDFFYMIADSWSMMIQYSAKTKFCSVIDLPETATDDEVIKNFADFSNQYWGTNFCAGGFYNTKQLADPARWETNSRSWRWQTCYQVSYFNTAPARGSLRDPSVNLDYHLNQCAAIFGKDMFPASMRANQVYGGEFPKAEKVFYSDFSDDPWQRASVWAPVSASQPYHLANCDDCGHCLDFHTPSESDPQPLKDSRSEFEGYLNQWLKE